MEPEDVGYAHADDMLIFKGRLHFNPSTLNNQIVTYFLARILQKDPNYTYDKWESLINKTGKLNTDFKRALDQKKFRPRRSDKEKKKDPDVEEADNTDLQVFNDWSVYGDGTTFPDFTVVAVYDSSKESPLTHDSKACSEIGKNVSAEVGQHKGNMADIDTDSQQMSKWFANTLVLADSVSLTMQPVSFTNMCQRVLNYVGSPALHADWYTSQSEVALKPKGQPLTSSPTLKRMFDKVMEKDSGYQFAFRANQYRYNTSTKESQVVGYIELIKTTLSPVQSANWRKATTTADVTESDGTISKDTYFGDIWFKQTKKGVLMDLASVIKDLCLGDLTNPKVPYQGLLVYPDKVEITNLSWTPTLHITDSKAIMEERGGIVFFPGVVLPEGPIINGGKLSFTFPVNKDIMPDIHRFPLPSVFDVQEYEFAPAIVERFKKTRVQDFVAETYEHSITYDIFCTRYGKPFEGERTFSLTPVNFGDSSCVTNYLDVGKVRKKIQKLIDKGGEYAGKTVDQVIQEYYGGQDVLDRIIQSSNAVSKIHNGDQNNYAYLLPGSNDPTKVWSVQSTGTDKNNVTVKFTKGQGSFSVEPNWILTDETNPRRQALDSLCLGGILQDGENGLTTDFTSLFYQNPSHKKDLKEKVDWVNFVGPNLRVMAMLYPAMQRLANLYQLKVSMQAMKRVFSIEDQMHPRYMPSTREMSPIEHRKIWKWLYTGLYNHSTLSSGWHIRRIPKPRMTMAAGILKDREADKLELIAKLHNAFKLEFGTIPLYLSAMYSVTPGSYNEQIFRSVLMDEMKHLCIVSNLLNALGAKPDYINNIPYYPCHLPGVFEHSTEPELAKPINVGPCTEDQLKAFIMIEYPSEVENIQLLIGNLKPESQARMNRLKIFLNLVKEQIDKNERFKTIGMLYEEIMDDFWKLHDLYKGQEELLYNGNRRKQFTYFMEGLTEIYDTRTALDQIRLIVEEGEGSHVFDLLGDINKKSHFFKFIEIFLGCRAVSVTSQIPHGDMHKEEFTIAFTDENVPYEMSDIQAEWKQQHVKEVREEINHQIKLERATPAKFPNLYADPSFQGAFRRMVVELDEVFNDDPKEINEQSYDSIQMTKFENAVSKMKQMSMLARQLLRPNTEQVGYKPIPGVPPNFNIGPPPSPKHKE